MEQELVIGKQTISFDREATVDLYRKTVTVAGSKSCDCIPCKNFAAQKENVFPTEFLGLLDGLGIDRTKEWEALSMTGTSVRLRNLFCMADGSSLWANSQAVRNPS